MMRSAKLKIALRVIITKLLVYFAYLLLVPNAQKGIIFPMSFPSVIIYWLMVQVHGGGSEE